MSDIIRVSKYIYHYYRGTLDNYISDPLNAREFTYTIEKRGVIAIKMGQWLSHRDDILSENMINALRPLQKNIKDTNSYKEVYDILRNELGSYMNMVIDPVILGSGSISQVHCIKIDDVDYVVKIHRKGVLENFQREYIYWKNFIYGIRIFQLRFAIDLEGFLNAIRDQFYYEKEFDNYKKIRFILSDLDFVTLPNMKYVKKGCMVMTQIKGFTYIEIQENYPEYLRDMSEKLMISYFWMVYCGHVHTDMHDGNFLYMVDEEDDANNKIGLFDFGLGFSLPSRGDSGIAMLLWNAFIRRDKRRMADLFGVILKHKPNKHVLNELDPFRLVSKEKELSFCEWLEDLLFQLSEKGCVIETRYMYVFMGFILLARSFVSINGDECIEFDVFGSSLRAMAGLGHEPIARVGKRMLMDFEIFSNETGTKEKVNKTRTVHIS